MRTSSREGRDFFLWEREPLSEPESFEGSCQYYGHEQHGETHTLRLRRGNGRVSLLGFFLFGGFLVAILLVSVGAIVLIVNVIIVALGKEMGVKVNK